MADETGNITSPEGTLSNGANGEDTLPQVGVLSQYVKDLSVENPNAPDVYQWEGQPQIDIQFNIGSKKISDDVHEVELKIQATAHADKGVAFAVELLYCGLFGLRNVTDEQAHPFVYAEAPRLLFPFARAILADAVRDAGFPPLMLEPIDFAALYLQQRAASQEQGNAGESDAPFGNA
ncbi:MAG: protein-export chaperone SecB [Parasphingorhabdus sp.]|nr:protein-export chaperone SecB [Parasphingorhabdus sp.]